MNENARIYICTHTDFDCPVSHPVYEIADSRQLFPDDKADNGIDALFYSELLTYHHLAKHPDLAALVRKHGCIATTPRQLKMSVYHQYAHHFSFADMDVMAAIIRCQEPWLWSSFKRMLMGNTLYTCNMFIMRRDDFIDLIHCVWRALDAWLDVCGRDLPQRILQHPELYFKNGGRGATIPNQIRMGGHLGERIVSAIIAQRYPECLTYDIHLTEKARPRKNISL